MDTVYAAGQSQTVASPLQVIDKQPAQGTVDKRAVESVTEGSALNTDDHRPVSEPEAPVVRLIRDFAYHLHATLSQIEQSIEAAQVQSNADAGPDKIGEGHVDTYA